MQAAHAPIRFGLDLGLRGDEALPADPVVWLQKQLDGDGPAEFDARLPTNADGLTVLREQFKLETPSKDFLVRPLFQAEAMAPTRRLLSTDPPFRERLVWFWVNHFTVSIRQGGTSAVIGPYIREAIRPNKSLRSLPLARKSCCLVRSNRKTVDGVAMRS